jgi:hypothetical protein
MNDSTDAENSLTKTEGDTVTLDANKALIRRVFEEVIPAGDSTAMRDLVAPDFIDHDPLPGQAAGVQGAEYVVSTMHGAHRTYGSRSTTWSPREIESRSAGRSGAPTPARCSGGRPPVSRSNSRPS